MFKKTKKAFGLDINDDSIKIFQFAKKGRLVYPTVFGSVPIPEGAIVNANFEDKEIIVNAVRKIIANPRQGKINTKYVVISLPESKCFLRIIKLPKMTDKEVIKAIKYEAEQHIPLKIDQVYLDWQIIDRKENHLNVLIVASPKELVNSYVEILNKANLIPIAVETESIAITRSLIGKELSNKSILIVNLDQRRTSFIIFDNIIQFTANIPITGEEFTKSIMKNLDTEKEKAEKLKRDVGLDKKDEKLFKILGSSIDRLVDEMNNTIDFYKEHSEGKKVIDKIILCGESSKIPGLIPYIIQRAKRPVEIGNPWVNVFDPSLKIIPPIPKKDSQGYTTVIGLALRGFLYEDYDKLTST